MVLLTSRPSLRTRPRSARPSTASWSSTAHSQPRRPISGAGQRGSVEWGCASDSSAVSFSLTRFPRPATRPKSIQPLCRRSIRLQPTSTPSTWAGTRSSCRVRHLTQHERMFAGLTTGVPYLSVRDLVAHLGGCGGPEPGGAAVSRHDEGHYLDHAMNASFLQAMHDQPWSVTWATGPRGAHQDARGVVRPQRADR